MGVWFLGVVICHQTLILDFNKKTQHEGGVMLNVNDVCFWGSKILIGWQICDDTLAETSKNSDNCDFF